MDFTIADSRLSRDYREVETSHESEDISGLSVDNIELETTDGNNLSDERYQLVGAEDHEPAGERAEAAAAAS